MSFTSYSVDNDKAFRKSLDQAQKKIRNLTVPLTLISKDFYKSEKAIFQLKGPGQYQDLAESTKKAKKRKGISVYPILGGATGRLGKSLTNPGHSDAINQITNKRSLVIGSKVPYLVYHQSDKPRSKLPLRKVLFIGPESRFANSQQKGRLSRWNNILSDFVIKKVGS